MVSISGKYQAERGNVVIMCMIPSKLDNTALFNDSRNRLTMLPFSVTMFVIQSSTSHERMNASTCSSPKSFVHYQANGLLGCTGFNRKNAVSKKFQLLTLSLWTKLRVTRSPPSIGLRASNNMLESTSIGAETATSPAIMTAKIKKEDGSDQRIVIGRY